VTEVAASLVLDSERDRKGLHRSHVGFRRQHFEVLRSILRVSGDPRDHTGRKDCHQGESGKDTPELFHAEKYTPIRRAAKPVVNHRVVVFLPVVAVHT